MLLTPLLIVPAIWAHGRIEQYNFDLTRDLSKKALPGYLRMEPSDPPLRGTLFFRRPARKPLEEAMKNAELRLTTQVEGSRLPDEQPPSSAGNDRVQVGEAIVFLLSVEPEEP